MGNTMGKYTITNTHDTRLLNDTSTITFFLKFTAGSDYESLNQVLTFPANTTILTQCVNITILQDSTVENSFEFFSVLVNSTISVSPVSVTVIIQDDNDRK